MAIRSPRAKPRLVSARAMLIVMASSSAYVYLVGTSSPPRSITATLLRSRSRRIKSPRFSNDISDSRLRLWRSGMIRASPARKQLTLGVKDPRFGGGDPVARPHGLAFHDQIARQRSGVIIHPHVDGRNATTELAHHCPVGAEIDQCRENTTVGIAALDVDHP